MTTDFYAVLGVRKTASEHDIKSAYRALAHKYHPDKNPAASAVEFFRKITEAYAVLGDPDKRKKYDTNGDVKPITVRSRKNAYTIDNPTALHGDVASIYKSGSYALKVVRSASDNDLLQNEMKVLKHIFSDKSKEAWHLYFNEPVESFRLSDGGVRNVNVFPWLGNFFNLHRVKAAHPQLCMEHGVWMLNRMLEALDFLHNKKKIIHGAILPEHVMVYASTEDHDKFNHGAKLIGFGASISAGERIRVVSPAYLDHFYPPEVKAKKMATPATDIYMAIKCFAHVLGADPVTNLMPSHIPPYITRFVQGCLLANQSIRPQSAWELHQELDELLLKHYGPKKYFKFTMPV